jgi:hypothetical protein
MSGFWKCICLVLFGLFLAALGANFLHPPVPRMYEYAWPTAIQKLYGLTWGACLVAVIWAICFRPQLENRKISLLSLFALIAMEAVYLLALRIADPWHQFSN